MRYFVLASLMSATPVAAQEYCAPYQEIISALDRGYGEQPIVGGGAGPNGVMWLANPATGSWTVIVVGPDGTACVVASGVRFTAFDQGDPA